MAAADGDGDGDNGGGIGNGKKNLTSSPALQNELRVALHYWTTRWYAHHHPALTATPTVDRDDETGANNAERLLDVIIALSQKDGDSDLVVDKVLGVDGNAALTNLMDSYLLPCHSNDGSSDHVASSSSSTSTSAPSISSTSKSVNINVWSSAIQNALRVHQKMYRLINNGSNSMGEDTLVWNSTLNVLSKLCVVLSQGHRLDESKRAELVDAINASVIAMVDEKERQPITSNELTVDNVIRIMESMLREAERRYYDDNDVALMPDVCTYNTVIGTMARYHATKNDGLGRIERYVRRMEMAEDGESSTVREEDGREKQQTSSSHQYPATCPPDVVTYNSLLYVHSSLAARPFQGEKGNAASLAASHSKDAAAVLRAMEERYSKTNRPDVQPDTISYATVLHSYANVGNAKEAQRILEHMERLSQTNGWKGRVEPNTICFNSTLHALSKSKENDAPHRAEALLQRMERLAVSHPELGIRPDTISWSAVIATWARSNARDGAERAEELLQRTLREYEEGNNDHVKPDIITHNTVLDAWAKQSARRKGRAALEAAQRADSLVAEMERGGTIKPCTISYNILIDAWSKSGCKGSAEKAESILRRMSEPDEISWNNVLAAYSNNGRDDGLVSALRLLKEMEESDGAVKPSTISYNLIMDAMTHRGTIESAEKAEKILDKMEGQFEAGNTAVKPSGVSYNIVINGYAKSGSPDAGDKAQALLKRMGSAEVSPDAISYTSVIDSFANSGQRDAADRAENLLNTMHAESGIAPSRVTFNSVMNAVAKSGASGSAQRAEAILKQMEDLYQAGNSDVRPDDISYSTVLNAWARSGESDAADRAEAILFKLEKASKQGTGVKPNAYCYSSVLNALARSKDPTAPERALALLNRMDEMYQGGNRDARPNSFCFNAVINAFAKSNDDAKATKSYQLLQRMLHEYESGRNRDAKPSVMTYSTVLNSCAYTRGSSDNRREAFQIARACLRDVLSMGGANSSVPFSMFLLTCARLAPRGAERDVLVESVFKECCRRGVVDELVVRNLRSAASPALLSKLLGRAGRDVAHAELPQDWKCNLEKRRRYRN